jgi:dihydrofolate reductase
MRKMMVSTFLSLDGYMAGPEGERDMGWYMDTFTPDMGLEFAATQAHQDTMLLGKKTYELFAQYWPEQPDANPAARFINHITKVVVSSTLEEVPWGNYHNATVMRGNLAEEVTKLKQQPGKDIVLPGSASLVQQLTRFGLIDE